MGDWGKLNLPVIDRRPATAVYFILVLTLVSLGLLNLILTVIVDKAVQARHEDVRLIMQQRQEEFAAAKKDLMRLCLQLDTDQSGQLSQEELLRGFDMIPDFHEAMEMMDVGREDLVALFSVLDQDNS